MTTFLSSHHDFQWSHMHQTSSLNLWTLPSSPSSARTAIESISLTMPQSAHPVPRPSTRDGSKVAHALEVARDSPEGSQDPKVCSILDTALAQIWAKLQAQPDTYVMTRDEFAVFNFFQYRFIGNELAVAARKRYWDNVAA
ncbi:hypothetical protein DL766_005151 [Monosporascus sp. MC13-8B]|uniref:Uncharacterized protein n=1 Tax=Monosporascus cannonballus TaxID=155416 RepID=A0ABY0HMR5_9PEZI|nr:hypothetical protein DL762_000633 [Monosporascus cannonballus]RYP01422.1 hypothetical protein DL763_000232 [Monosporascus cannonballus]RYP29852.1 hypothetical protein DL766_005151 [Monosporascus sp. MC13-8B]